MASEPRKGLPSFWSTTLAKVLVGDQPCNLSAWLSGHFDLEKRDRDDQSNLTKWKVEHTALLEALANNCLADGWTIRKEQFFRVKGQTAILSGKADLVTQGRQDRRPTIWDCKSGKPRESDTAQVLIEMVMMPLAWRAPGMQFDGAVYYADGTTIWLTPADVKAFKPRLFAKLRELGRTERPAAAPSRDACRFCDVSEIDCPDRFKGQPDAETTEF